MKREALSSIYSSIDRTGLKLVKRPNGKPAGSWIDGMVATGSAPMLCPACISKFDAKRHNYVAAARWGRIIGQCDGCRTHDNRNVLFIHESTVSDSGGNIQSGQVYTPY